MNKREAQKIVRLINIRQQQLSLVSNDELRSVVHNMDIVDVYAALKELSIRLSKGDLCVKATAKDKSFSEYDFVDIEGKNAIFHNCWEVYGEIKQWNMVYYDEQLLAGVLMHYGFAVEMATGEGKTLAATLPATLNALTHKGVHLMTVNPYLSRRDYEQTRPLYAFLGLTSDCIEKYAFDDNLKIRKAYSADIVFGTNSNFTFDYLRDNLQYNKENCRQRNHFFAIVDELDSILIDEAINPHIISGNNSIFNGKLYRQWAPEIRELVANPKMYRVDKVKHKSEFTQEGIKQLDYYSIHNTHDGWIPVKVDKQPHEDPQLRNVWQQLLNAYTLYEKNVDYLVMPREINGLFMDFVVIIDFTTGRRKDISRWEYGLHSAIEAKEGVLIQPDSVADAVISIKNYFRLYQKCAGMSGTIMSVAKELKDTYGLRSERIPTHNPLIREDRPILIYRTIDEKNSAIVDMVQLFHSQNRPILVGCPNIVREHEIAKLLKECNLNFELLDATDFGEEAYIVSQAGKAGAITIATNMAGRGTDIKLDDEAKRRGGLVVISTEMSNSSRIDNQLRGRSGRQGDEGTSIITASLEDFILKCLSKSEQKEFQLVLEKIVFNGNVSNDIIRGFFVKAQRNRDLFYKAQRKKVSRKDDSIAIQRTSFYKERNKILTNDNYVHQIIKKLLKKEGQFDQSRQLLHGLYLKCDALIRKMLKEDPNAKSMNLVFADKEVFLIGVELNKEFTEDCFVTMFERNVLLTVYDDYWRNFVRYICSDLTSRQIDKLNLDVEELKCKIDKIVRHRMLHTTMPLNEKVKEEPEKDIENNSILDYATSVIKKDELCPCGSGLMYAECHGKSVKHRRR